MCLFFYWESQERAENDKSARSVAQENVPDLYVQYTFCSMLNFLQDDCHLFRLIWEGKYD